MLNRVLLIDHYDSFTQLIKSYFEVLHATVKVVQSERLTDDACATLLKTFKPTHVLLSPGPGHPIDYPKTRRFILNYLNQYPMLGVCLGLQCMVEALGGRVVRAPSVCHGKVFDLHHAGEGLFKALPSPFDVTRYHSLIAEEETLPEVFECTAWTHDAAGGRVVMGIQYQNKALYGVQYHPEAALTAYGSHIFELFLNVLI